MEVFYVCIDGTSWECWLCSSLVVVWQTFSLCTFTSCLVDILSQALLAKQQQQEEEGADVAFILKLVCRRLTRRLVVVLLCTALQGLSRLLRLKAYILSLFCELLLCSLAQQSAGNVAMVYKFYLYNRYYSQKEDQYSSFFLFFENRIYVFILHFTLLLELQVFTPIRGGHNVFKRIQFIYLQVSYCLKKYYYVLHYYNKYMQYHISVFYIYICNKKILISAKAMQSSFMYYLNKISLLYIQPMRCCQVIFALQICAVAKVTICQLARISL